MTEASVPLLDLSRQHAALEPGLTDAVRRVLASGQYILGAEVAAFESALAAHLGVAHAIGVANGTDAIWLGLRAVGVGPGDLVLTSPFTFFATASAICLIGATPVFADIDPVTFDLDPHAAAQVLAGDCPVLRRLGHASGRIRALLPVHLYGHPADLGALRDLGERHGLPVVEDAAQALGATFQGASVGRSRHAVAFSCFPSKNLGACGDAGVVTTDDDGVASRLRLLRAHGSARKYHHEVLGANSRLDPLQAALLGVKLPHLDAWVAARARHAAAYGEALAGLPGITPPATASGCGHAWHQYTVRVTGRVASGKRDALAAHLAVRGIGHAVYYPGPVHLQPALAHLGHRPGDFPLAEAACAEVLSLPVFPELTNAERTRVVDAIAAFVR
jgi:dTDP-4-amino-4,6-dideoxygalactose transaminase